MTDTLRGYFFFLIRFLSADFWWVRSRPGRLYVLMFHQVNDDPATFYPALPISTFRTICSFVKRNFDVIHVSEVESHFSKSNRSAVTISFDDAHYDIIKNAYPILTKLDLKFNVNIDTEVLETGLPQDFVRVYDILNSTQVSEFSNPRFLEGSIAVNRSRPIETENRFTEVLSALSPQDKRAFTEEMDALIGGNARYSQMLSLDDVRFLAKSDKVEFGAHGHCHAILPNLTDEALERELVLPKQILENVTGRSVNILAYPNGVSDSRVRASAAAHGYRFFLKTDDRYNVITSHSTDEFYRVNQYHRSADECLAYTFGFHQLVRDALRRLRR